MKKILIVNYEFPPLGGGGGVATYELAKELAKKYEIHCLTSGVSDLKEYELVDGIHVHRVMIKGRKNRSTATILSMYNFITGSKKIAERLCSEINFDCLWTWFAIPSGIVGTKIAKRWNIPHTLTIVGGDIYDPSKKTSPHRFLILRKIVSSVINNADAVTAISNDVKNKAIEYYDVRNSIKVLPLGFTPKIFSKLERKELEFDERAFYFIATGRLVKRKGFLFLIKALALMKSQTSKLIIIGDGPLENSLKEASKNLGVEGRVVFAGYVGEEKKMQYLATSDCYVLSSLHEGFGIVLQEAMFCGLPIVSTDQGGQTDFLKHEKNAILVPVERSDKLAGAMDRIMQDSSLRDNMTKNNLREINNFYTESVVKLYEDTIIGAAQ